MRDFVVATADELLMYADVDSTLVDDGGELYLLDENEDVLAIFAPGVWAYFSAIDVDDDDE